MTRLLRTIGCALLFALLAVLPQPPPVLAEYEDLFQQARAAAWAIYVRSDSGLRAVCSATAYKSTAAQTFMVTAGHCWGGSLASDRRRRRNRQSPTGWRTLILFQRRHRKTQTG